MTQEPTVKTTITIELLTEPDDYYQYVPNPDGLENMTELLEQVMEGKRKGGIVSIQHTELSPQEVRQWKGQHYYNEDDEGNVKKEKGNRDDRFPCDYAYCHRLIFPGANQVNGVFIEQCIREALLAEEVYVLEPDYNAHGSDNPELQGSREVTFFTHKKLSIVERDMLLTSLPTATDDFDMAQ